MRFHPPLVEGNRGVLRRCTGSKWDSVDPRVNRCSSVRSHFVTLVADGDDDDRTARFIQCHGGTATTEEAPDPRAPSGSESTTDRTDRHGWEREKNTSDRVPDPWPSVLLTFDFCTRCADCHERSDGTTAAGAGRYRRWATLPRREMLGRLWRGGEIRADPPMPGSSTGSTPRGDAVCGLELGGALTVRC